MYKYNINFENIIAVTNRKLCKRPFLKQIEKVCQYYPKAIILREKDLMEKEYAILAEEVINICRTYCVYCILHTYIDVAKQMNCNAIHLPLPLLRKYQNQLQNFNVIGTSVHSIEDAIEAEKIGASYMIAGHIYTTECKKGIMPKGLIFLNEICQNTSLPVYGIGGIKLHQQQINEVMNCCAKGACIMSGMMVV